MDLEKLLQNSNDIENLDENSRFYLSVAQYASDITDTGELDSLENLEAFLEEQGKNVYDKLDKNTDQFFVFNIIMVLSEHLLSADFDTNIIRKCLALGLYPMAIDINGTNILFVRHHDIKLLITASDFRIPHNVPHLIEKKFKDYTITFNKDFHGCINAIQEAYPDNWIYPKLVAAYEEIHKNPDNRVSIDSVEIWHNGKLVAGEIGFITGNAYASLSGFHKENDIGNVQMALLGQFLFENGFAYWDLGMSLPYKYRYGAKDCDRETQAFYHSTLSKNRIPFPADKTFSIADIWENLSHSKSFLEMAPVHKEEKISTKPEDLIPFAEPNTKYKDFGRQISEIDFSYSGDISLQRLYSAYMQGVFPWWNEEDNEPPAWYSPDPRFVIMTEEYHCPSSLKKFMKKCPYTFTMDQCFHKVITECARMKRTDQDGTWIGPKMIKAYTKFHKAGYAHSFEVWHKGKLAGGFYGVLIGKIFFGESMFTIEDNSSKCVYSLFMKAFAECGGVMVDCQVYTDNMARYGGKNISRDAFLHIEKENLLKPLNKDLKETFNSLAEAFRRNM